MFSALLLSVYMHRATFMYEQFPEVMNMLWYRMLKDNKKNWRRVYKVNVMIECSIFSIMIIMDVRGYHYIQMGLVIHIDLG